MMKRGLNPFDVPESFRGYLYNRVVLAWETGQFQIRKNIYSKKDIETEVGFRIEHSRKLREIDMKFATLRGPKETMIFYVDGRGYECLFKRLRDAFAHGHYGTHKSNWITIQHRFKGRNEKTEATRLFDQLRQSKLKRLIDFLDNQ